MKLNELEEKLRLSNVPKRWYSINEGLKPNACILDKNHMLWKYFYLDEKGNESDPSFFANEEDAYDFLWKKLKYQLDFFKPKL